MRKSIIALLLVGAMCLPGVGAGPSQAAPTRNRVPNRAPREQRWAIELNPSDDGRFTFILHLEKAGGPEVARGLVEFNEHEVRMQMGRSVATPSFSLYSMHIPDDGVLITLLVGQQEKKVLIRGLKDCGGPKEEAVIARPISVDIAGDETLTALASDAFDLIYTESDAPAFRAHQRLLSHLLWLTGFTMRSPSCVTVGTEGGGLCDHLARNYEYGHSAASGKWNGGLGYFECMHNRKKNVQIEKLVQLFNGAPK